MMGMRRPEFTRRVIIRSIAATISAPLMAAAGCAKAGLRHPSLEPFHAYEQPQSDKGAVTARFFGTTSVLFDDGQTRILSDGFVTRPSRSRVVGRRIMPDALCVDRTLTSLGVKKIDAVFTGHSHYDHAMDAPVFAKETGAVLLGSASTWNIGWGWGLRQDQLRVVRDRDTHHFGQFALTFVESRHSPVDLAPGIVDVPLVPPARFSSWKTDSAWSVLIQHGERSLLMHGSGNYIPGALHGRRAEVVYLGIGALRRQSDEFLDAYWSEVVSQVGARRVILVHWDDFFRTLDKPLRALRSPHDSLPEAMRRITDRARATKVEVLLPVLWQPTDPFAGL